MTKKRILVVEDDALIAMELEERLADMGYAVIGPAMTIEAAEQAIAAEKPDAALLDANLAGKSSLAFAAALAARGVPVAFCTGYDRIKGMPASLAKAPVLTKPITDAQLSDTLKRMIGG